MDFGHLYLSNNENEKVENLKTRVFFSYWFFLLTRFYQFSANWMYEFQKTKTRDLTFYSLGEKAVQTKMMTMDDIDLKETKFNYTHNIDLKAQVCALMKRHMTQEAIGVKLP